MTDLQHDLRTARPVAPSDVGRSSSAAADAYQRAVQARPTDFAENPIGAVANAMDRIGRAATGLLHKTAAGGGSSLQQDEERLRQASEAAKANPTPQAREKRLAAAMLLLRNLRATNPGDPRVAQLSRLVVDLANSLGAAALRISVPGLDVHGMLRIAAALTSRLGDGAGMQHAFQLEQMLKGALPGSVAEAAQLRSMLLARNNVSRGAAQALTNGWAVKLAAPGEQPKVDVSARTISLNAALEQPSLAVLAKAYWHDTSMANPAEKDGFMKAFAQLANLSSFSILHRKHKEARRLARQQLGVSGAMSASGGVALAVRPTGSSVDESADAFASLAVYSRTNGAAELPEALRPALAKFFA